MRYTRIFAAAAMLLVCNTIFAQNAYDALNFAQFEYEGTARSMAMGNAFTALGGDLGGVSVNPAGAAVFSKNEFGFSLGVNPYSSTSNYTGGESGAMHKFQNTELNVPNIGGIAVFETGNYTGLININLGFNVTRTRNFNNGANVSGINSNSSWLGNLAYNTYGINSAWLDGSNAFYDCPATSVLGWRLGLLSNVGDDNMDYVGATENLSDPDKQGIRDIYVGGPLQQDFYKKVTGGTQEFSFNVSGNISDRLYLGVNLNLYSVDMNLYEEINETPVNFQDFQTGIQHCGNEYHLTTGGSGINLKFGAIWRPFSFLRLGATITTPTRYELTDTWYNYMSARFNGFVAEHLDSPDYDYSYSIKTPMRWSVGGALTLGSRAIISVDYEGADYSHIQMADFHHNPSEFREDNDLIAGEFRNAGNLRVGAELRVTHTLSLRGGYNHFSSPEISYDSSWDTFSGGLGFRVSESTYFDFAYLKNIGNKWESFNLYGNYGDIKATGFDRLGKTSKLVFTVGFKF